MFNTNNFCFFEGRVAKDPVFSTVNGYNGPTEKVMFTLAVDKSLTASQKQGAEQTADFVQFSAIGKIAETVKSWCPKGKAVKVVAQYATYESINQQSGQKEYRHIFNVDSLGFTTKDAQYLANGNGIQQVNNNNGGFQQQNNFNNGGFQQPQQQNNFQQPQQQNNFQQPQQENNFQMFETNGASPF